MESAGTSTSAADADYLDGRVQGRPSSSARRTKRPPLCGRNYAWAKARRSVRSRSPSPPELSLTPPYPDQAPGPKTPNFRRLESDLRRHDGRVCLAACSGGTSTQTEEPPRAESSYADELAADGRDLMTLCICRRVRGRPRGPLEYPRWAASKSMPQPQEPMGSGPLASHTIRGRPSVASQSFHGDRLVDAIYARQSIHLRQFFGASRISG